MPLELIEEKLNGIKLFAPKVFGDNRGWFTESYRKDELEKFGISAEFVQDNHSMSTKDVLRGMHFQHSPPQDKLIRVTKGKAQVVEVDIRIDSPTFGHWVSFELSEENKHILWVPAGFANGFLTLTDVVEMQYKVTNYWNAEGESNIKYDDPDLVIEWLSDNPIISERDTNAGSLKNWKENGFKF
ncbi:MAG: dTDP-4-dehydrorhamnose 3,5-epimerase [Candidatus Kapaibacterium sp.]